MKQTRRKYSKEFKLEAVRQMDDPNKANTQLARELGVDCSLLYKWREQFGREGVHAFPGKGSQTPEAEELKRLRAENAELRQERDFLKKATAYFARMSK